MLFLFLAWRRRWIGDDGLIFVRVVRQLLAGHGPVYNVGDRAEAATSTLWTYLVAGLTWASGADPARVAVYTGLVLSTAGVALAIDGTRRMWRAELMGRRSLLPAGVLVVLGLPPFWDFATSGLDTALAFFWIGGLWWLLVRVRAAGDPGWRTAVVAVFVCGLGPLVRPELGLVSVVFAITLFAMLRPLSKRRIALLSGCLLALPCGYEIFRAAYYGLLVPLPALSKEASTSDWHRGLSYVIDFVGPYWLVLPALVIVAVLVLGLRRGGRGPFGVKPDRLLFAAPVIAGLLMTLYVIRVGGDFMHARMLLAPVFLVLLPTLVLPARTTSAVGVVALAVWAGWCAVVPKPDLPEPGRPVGAHGIDDERAFWLLITNQAHPTTASAFVTRQHMPAVMAKARQLASKSKYGELVVATGYGQWSYLPLRSGLPWRVVLVWGTLGTGGAAARLDEAVLDPVGLAYPLAAHSEIQSRTRPGHDKELPLAFVVADLAAPTARLRGLDPALVADARRQLQCPSVRRVLASTRGSLDAGRAWDNLVGAFGETLARFPVDPSDHPHC